MMFNFSDETQVLQCARKILEARLKAKPVLAQMNSESVKAFLVLNAAGKEHEELHVMFLNDNLEMIAFDLMGIGTHDQVNAAPRDVALAALKHKATKVVVTHNHPVGSSRPSTPDILYTKSLGAALALIDVSLEDHLVVCKNEVTSIRQFCSDPRNISEELMEAFGEYDGQF